MVVGGAEGWRGLDDLMMTCKAKGFEGKPSSYWSSKASSAQEKKTHGGLVNPPKYHGNPSYPLKATPPQEIRPY